MLHQSSLADLCHLRVEVQAQGVPSQGRIHFLALAEQWGREEAGGVEAEGEDGDAGRSLRVRRRWPRWC